MSECLNCITSPCCKLYDVTVSKKEYEAFDLHMQSCLIKTSDVFINKNPHLSDERKKRFLKYIEENSEEKYATLKKQENGYCVLIDNDTKLCGHYEKRPIICREYTIDNCAQLR